MPLNPDCHICHGDPEKTMLCSACVWDLDTAFHQISLLQRQVQGLMKRTGYRHREPMIRDSIVEPKDFTVQEAIGTFDPRCLQGIFREMDDDILSGVLYSLKTKELVQRMKENLSKNHLLRLLENLSFGVADFWAEDCCGKFIKTIKQLESMGEIVVHRDSDEEVYLNSPDGYVKPTEEEIEARRRAQTERWEKFKEEDRQRRAKQKEDYENWLLEVGLK